jgi:hypothetical protein
MNANERESRGIADRDSLWAYNARASGVFYSHEFALMGGFNGLE